MFEQVTEVVRRYNELNDLLASPEVVKDADKLRALARERADLTDLVEAYEEYRRLSKEIEDTRALLQDDDPDLKAMASEEMERLEPSLQQVEERLKALLAPKDPRDDRNVIVEIRAGTGGEEAALFAGDLFRMYSLYAANQGWKTQVLSTSDTGIGGYKEIIFEVVGKGAYSRLKYESGVHRVQRVPVTEASGRIHTSTATVAVLPAVEEVDVQINDRDLRIDLYRSAGHGGQGVNTTDSAVRITHLPTGIVVQCQDERSQLQNKARAMSILRARIYDLEFQRRANEVDEARRKQVGTGERSEKIRTYNFPQNRVTDHRIGLSVYQLEAVLTGGLEPFIQGLTEAAEAERLEGPRNNGSDE